MIPNPRHKRTAMQTIVELCERHAGCAAGSASSRGRSFPAQAARMAATFVGQLYGYSYPSIAEAMGRTSHNTFNEAMHRYQGKKPGTEEVIELARKVIGEVMAEITRSADVVPPLDPKREPPLRWPGDGKGPLATPPQSPSAV